MTFKNRRTLCIRIGGRRRRKGVRLPAGETGSHDRKQSDRPEKNETPLSPVWKGIDSGSCPPIVPQMKLLWISSSLTRLGPVRIWEPRTFHSIAKAPSLGQSDRRCDVWNRYLLHRLHLFALTSGDIDVALAARPWCHKTSYTARSTKVSVSNGRQRPTPPYYMLKAAIW